jgi:hypothetical protein
MQLFHVILLPESHPIDLIYLAESLLISKPKWRAVMYYGIGEDQGDSLKRLCSSQGRLSRKVEFNDFGISPYKRFPYKGRILLSDILGRRRPVIYVRESYPRRGGSL